MPSFWRAHSHVLIALGTGIAVGASLTLIIHRISNTFGRDLMRLVMQIESLKRDLEQLKNSLEEKEKTSPTGFYSIHPSSAEEDDDDDEFQEAFEGDSLQEQSLTSDEFVSLHSSDSLSVLDAQRFLKELDILLDGDDSNKEEAFHLLKKKEETLSSNPSYLWRLAKSAFSMSQIEGARGNPEEKKKLVYLAKDKALRSLELNDRDPQAHKWCAIALGSVGDYEGTQAKILNGYKFKEHIEKAIAIEPKDASSLHLMGRWCFGVYMLSWIERKAAATLFAAPPTATIDEALDHFLKAEIQRPAKWKENILFIAKCYIEKSDYYSAFEWLDKANTIQSISQDDRDAQVEIDKLRYKYSGYRR